MYPGIIAKRVFCGVVFYAFVLQIDEINEVLHVLPLDGIKPEIWPMEDTEPIVPRGTLLTICENWTGPI